MNFLATPQRRKMLFAALYFSEGAPIGFLWLALPTVFRDNGVPVVEISQFTAVLVVPWTFKFAWAPLVDLLRSRFWTLKHWILTAQTVMTLTLVPLLALDLQDDFGWIVALLVVHAIAAATQDVAIDALCISVTQPHERGAYNGWMQAGMLLGRSLLGGGALVLAAQFGNEFAIVLLMLCVASSAVLLGMSRIPPDDTLSQVSPDGERHRFFTVLGETWSAVCQPSTWLGLLFALAGGAAFKALEVMIGPFLLDRGFTQSEIGWFTAIPMIGAMIVGSLIGGRLADRVKRKTAVISAMLWIVGAVALLAACDFATAFEGTRLLLAALVLTAFGIGLFTASSYALFMDLTRPGIAGTQFSAFMGATNGCEVWSTLLFGQIVAAWSYPTAMLTLCTVTAAAIGLVVPMKLPAQAGADRDVRLAEIVNADNIRMVEAGERFRLAGKSLGKVRVGGRVGLDDLQCDESVELGLPRLVDGSHSAVPQQFNQFELREVRCQIGNIRRHETGGRGRDDCTLSLVRRRIGINFVR
eukprot:g26709.t1